MILFPLLVGGIWRCYRFNCLRTLAGSTEIVLGCKHKQNVDFKKQPQSPPVCVLVQIAGLLFKTQAGAYRCVTHWGAAPWSRVELLMILNPDCCPEGEESHPGPHPCAASFIGSSRSLFWYHICSDYCQNLFWMDFFFFFKCNLCVLDST